MRPCHLISKRCSRHLKVGENAWHRPFHLSFVRTIINLHRHKAVEEFRTDTSIDGGHRSVSTHDRIMPSGDSMCNVNSL
jgi:hypothetical protein